MLEDHHFHRASHRFFEPLPVLGTPDCRAVVHWHGHTRLDRFGRLCRFLSIHRVLTTRWQQSHIGLDVRHLGNVVRVTSVVNTATVTERHSKTEPILRLRVIALGDVVRTNRVHLEAADSDFVARFHSGYVRGGAEKLASRVRLCHNLSPVFQDFANTRRVAMVAVLVTDKNKISVMRRGSQLPRVEVDDCLSVLDTEAGVLDPGNAPQ